MHFFQLLRSINRSSCSFLWAYGSFCALILFPFTLAVGVKLAAILSATHFGVSVGMHPYTSASLLSHKFIVRHVFNFVSHSQWKCGTLALYVGWWDEKNGPSGTSWSLWSWVYNSVSPSKCLLLGYLNIDIVCLDLHICLCICITYLICSVQYCAKVLSHSWFLHILFVQCETGVEF